MPQDPPAHIRLENVVGITIVHFAEHKIVSEVSDQLYGLVEEGHRRLLLNFSNLNVLSSVAIAKLIGLQKKIIGLQGYMKICCVNPSLLELLRYVGLDRYIEIFETQENALRTF